MKTSAKWRPFPLGLNVINGAQLSISFGQHTYASINRFIVGSGNGLSPALHWSINDLNQRWLIFSCALRNNFQRTEFESIYAHFFKKKCVWKCRLSSVGHFLVVLMKGYHWNPGVAMMLMMCAMPFERGQFSPTLSHNRHPISRPWGILSVQNKIAILLLWLRNCM